LKDSARKAMFRKINSGRETDSEGRYIPDAKFYVVSTDRFMSGWGKAKDMKNKLIFPTNSLDEAKNIEDYAKNHRTDQTRVDIVSKKPKYDKRTNYIQLKMKHGNDNYSNWYKDHEHSHLKQEYQRDGGRFVDLKALN
jgi:hypothetical protein